MIVGPAQHNWLDEHKNVAGCRKLNEWGKNSVLAEIVEDVVNAVCYFFFFFYLFLFLTFFSFLVFQLVNFKS
jgi:hypothetical protein